MNELLIDTLENIHRTVLNNFIEITEAVEEWTMPPEDYDGS